MRALATSLLLACAFLGFGAATSNAFYLDKGRNFDVRFRGYSQLTVAAEKARDPNPDFSAGDINGQRNFYNPEFDAKLTDYTSWMRSVPGLSLLAPDEMKFRFAWWGFYDGIYDYADSQWDDARKGILKGKDYDAYKKVCAVAGCNPSLGPMARHASSTNVRRESFNFNDENKDLNGILRHRNRINELYIDYTKGPVFIRVGRQAISWGESDSISQLDVSNPFDITQGAPGFFQDTDEARIPLWTFRTTVKLLDAWKEISSVFLDTYLVPGVIDTTVPITPSYFGQPYSAAGVDPMLGILTNPTTANLPIHVSIVDRLPRNTWGNSRWGARLVGVLARDYTVSGWFFRTFPVQPAPQILGPSAVEVGTNPANASKLTLVDNRGFKTRACLDGSGSPIPRSKPGQYGHTPDGRGCKWAYPVVTQLNRHLESVVGIAATWFSQPVNGIIRAEGEYFIGEDAVIPSRNLDSGVQLPSGLQTALGLKANNDRPRADYLRFTLGYDTFFFMRALNPSNSFTFVTQYQGALNISEMRGDGDFRNSSTKPGRANQCTAKDDPDPSCKFQGTAVPDKYYENQHRYEHFLTIRLQTDYMHGRLSPGITAILDPSGIFGFDVGANYRITDNLIAGANFRAVEGSRRAGLATFRDRDQFQFRLTYQIN